MIISLLNISSPLPVQCWDMKEQLRAQTIDHFRDLCIKTRLSAQLLIWKWFFILMQINLIFTRKVVHLASFWEWGFLAYYSVTTITRANSTIISTWSDVISLNCWRLDFHLVKCLSNCQFLLRITRFFTKSCDSRSIMRNRSIAECQKPCIRGGATWCYSRHLSKLGNCFDEWTTGSNRQRRIMNPYRSPHRTDNTQTTSSSQTELRELLKILAVLPMESMEVERSFYCIRRILTYLASENNGLRTTFRFGRHRHVWR